MSDATRTSLKDKIIHSVSEAVKQILRYHSNKQSLTVALTLTNSDRQFQYLVEQLDRAFLHELKNLTHGYWLLAQEISHKDVIKEIRRLTFVTTNFGRGRAWLHTAMRDGLLESYVNCLSSDTKLVKKYYNKGALFADVQNVQLLLTIVAGLEHVTFDLYTDLPYLDLGCWDITDSNGPANKRSQQLPRSPVPDNSISITKDGFVTSDLAKMFPVADDASQTSAAEIAAEEALEREARSFMPQRSLVTSSNLTDAVSNIQVKDTDRLEVVHVHVPRRRKKERRRSLTGSVSTLDTASIHSQDTEEGDGGCSEPASDVRHRESTDRLPTLADDVIVAKDSEVAVVPAQSDRTDRKYVCTKPNILQSEVTINDNSTSEQQLEHDSKYDHLETCGHDSVSRDPGALTAVDPLPAICDDGDLDPADLLTSADAVTSANSSHNVETRITTDEPISSKDTPDSQGLAFTHSDAHDDLIQTATDVTSSDLGSSDEPEVSIYDLNAGSSLTDSGSVNLRADNGERKTTKNTAVLSPVESGPSQEEDFVLVTDILETSLRSSPEDHPAVVNFDNNLHLELMLSVFESEEDALIKMVKTTLGHSEGVLVPVLFLLTNHHIYITQHPHWGSKRLQFMKECSIGLQDLDYVSVGLSYQILQLVCRNRRKQLWITTADEALTRLLVDELAAAVQALQLDQLSVLTDATTQNISLKKYLGNKLQSEGLSLLSYSMLYWEEYQEGGHVMQGVNKEGTLMVRVTSYLYMYVGEYWKEAYFVLKGGVLYQYTSRLSAAAPVATVVLSPDRVVGCRRCQLDREHCFEIVLQDGAKVELSAKSAEELQSWLQSLCLAITEDRQTTNASNIPGVVPCCCAVTSHNIVLCHEDLQTNYFRTLALCEVSDVLDVHLDPAVPQYLVLILERSLRASTFPRWVVYFHSETERDRLLDALEHAWMMQFQVTLSRSNISDIVLQKHCRDNWHRVKSALKW